LYEIGDLLTVSSGQLRAAIGLLVGGGLADREIRHLQRGQLDVGRRRVTLVVMVPGMTRRLGEGPEASDHPIVEWSPSLQCPQAVQGRGTHRVSAMAPIFD